MYVCVCLYAAILVLLQNHFLMGKIMTLTVWLVYCAEIQSNWRSTSIYFDIENFSGLH